ncbi:hypothetical protein Noca_4656 [Nocardioides sp. JS614]|nr:hypothetical protein Noca_4656 [Nocardioides sp. JS614]
MLHTVSYDLSKPGHNYDDLYAATKSLGGWCHALESLWIASTDLTAVQVRDRLKAVIDDNDSLLVTQMSGTWASYNVGSSQTDWLQKSVWRSEGGRVSLPGDLGWCYVCPFRARVSDSIRSFHDRQHPRSTAMAQTEPKAVIWVRGTSVGSLVQMKTFPAMVRRAAFTAQPRAMRIRVRPYSNMAQTASFWAALTLAA